MTVPELITSVISLLTIPLACLGSSNCSHIATLCPFLIILSMYTEAA